MTLEDFYAAFIFGCKNHIKRYGRLIISDLWGQLSNSMWIIDSTKGIFHNHIETEEEGIKLRHIYEEDAKEELLEYILVGDPNDIGGIGRPPKLIPLKTLIKR